MRVVVGSGNPVKVAAVREALEQYELFKGAYVGGVVVASGVSPQPMSLEEAVRGAMNRAEAAHRECAYSIGLEAGWFPAPHGNGYLDVTACSIYDGKRHLIGLSSAFAVPPAVTDAALREGIEFDEAFRRAGYTDHPDIGSTEQGIIGTLTGGRVSRKAFLQQAVVMALVQLEQASLYHSGAGTD